MPRRSRMLKIRNPFYVRPARLDRSGRTTFKEAVRAYLGTMQVAMLSAGIAPNEKFYATRETMKDFAGQMDKQAVIIAKVKK